jgi:hypothetical protein
MNVSMAPETSTARCPGCAAIVVPGAAWCGLCFSPVTAATAFATAPAGPAPAGAAAADTTADRPTAAAATPVDVPGGFRPGGSAPVRAKIYTDSRWKSGSTTFGPVGRVVLTIFVFLPYPLFFFAIPIGLVGAGIWTLVIVPRALRDIWAPARRHHLPPQD